MTVDRTECVCLHVCSFYQKSNHSFCAILCHRLNFIDNIYVNNVDDSIMYNSCLAVDNWSDVVVRLMQLYQASLSWSCCCFQMWVVVLFINCLYSVGMK